MRTTEEILKDRAPEFVALDEAERNGHASGNFLDFVFEIRRNCRALLDTCARALEENAKLRSLVARHYSAECMTCREGDHCTRKAALAELGLNVEG